MFDHRPCCRLWRCHSWLDAFLYVCCGLICCCQVESHVGPLVGYDVLYLAKPDSIRFTVLHCSTFTVNLCMSHATLGLTECCRQGACSCGWRGSVVIVVSYHSMPFTAVPRIRCRASGATAAAGTTTTTTGWHSQPGWLAGPADQLEAAELAA